MEGYDYLIVGSGIFGSVVARQLADRGKKVLVIEKRGHIGGNCFTEEIEGINVHKYGAHIFHTDNERVWRYVNRFAAFNNFVHTLKVNYKNRLFSFPVNLMTLYQLFDVKTPTEALAKLQEEIIPCEKPSNLEEWALSKVGRTIYEIFIRGYTKKQWQKDPKELPASIVKRIPVRLTFDDRYFHDRYQGIPIGGYTKLFKNMLRGIDVRLNCEYFQQKKYWDAQAENVVYTGRIDEYFDYRLGALEYRGLRFDHRLLEGDFQGNAVINYTDEDIPFTRIIEHKHFEFLDSPNTVVTWEYPAASEDGAVPCYPVPTEYNNGLFEKYRQEALKLRSVVFGGRLAGYKYLDMDDAVLEALQTAEQLG